MAVAYLSLIMTATGYALWFRLVGMYRMNQIIPFILLVPVTSIIGSVLFLSGHLRPYVLVGGVIVLASVGFIHLWKAKPGQRPEPSIPESTGNPAP